MGFLEERAKWEKDYWAVLIRRCKGNISQMARESGFCRQNIYKVLERLQIKKVAPPGRRGNGAWRALGR